MSGKPFSLAILVGRFQMLHVGHAQIINTAAALADRTAVLIGSAQESGTEKNPFSYERRASHLKLVFGDSIEIYPLPDLGVGNNLRWGEYVLSEAERLCGEKPELAVSGEEERRYLWYSGLPIYQLIVPKEIPVSASELRFWLERDEKDRWMEYTPAALWSSYSELRREILAASGNTQTSSI